MMFKKIVISTLLSILVFLNLAAAVPPSHFHVEGTVTEAGTHLPVVGAVVKLGSDYLWTTTDMDGSFTFDNVQKGDWTIAVSCLGYVSTTKQIRVCRMS